MAARQASHTRPALRLGGVGIAIAMIGVCTGWGNGDPHLLALVFSALPLLIVGLLEDVGAHQAPLKRLSAAALSGIIFIMIEGILIDRIGVPMLTPLFSFAPVAFVFTLFATTGLIHAFNLIDGLNGLSGSAAIISTAALLLVASQAGVTSGDLTAYSLLGAVLGFLMINFPSGRIFMGDGGAYLVGFMLAWLSVLLLNAAPAFSPWAVLLIFFWPVADTLLAIWRRLRKQVPLGQPDRLHVHQVIMRTLEIVVVKRRDRTLTNPLTTVLMQPLMLAPVLAGVVFWDSNRQAAMAVMFFSVIFVGSYLYLIRFVRLYKGPLALAGLGSISLELPSDLKADDPKGRDPQKEHKDE